MENSLLKIIYDMRVSTKFSIMTLAIVFALSVIGPSVALAAGPAPVDLLSAGNFTILSKSGITDVPSSVITGNVG